MKRFDDVAFPRGQRDSPTFMHLACLSVVSGGQMTVGRVQAIQAWQALTCALIAEEKTYLPVIKVFLPDAVQVLNARPIQPFDHELFVNKRELYERLTRTGVDPIVADVIMLDERREVLSSTTLVLLDRKSTRLNSSHSGESRMPSSA